METVYSCMFGLQEEVTRLPPPGRLTRRCVYLDGGEPDLESHQVRDQSSFVGVSLVCFG